MQRLNLRCTYVIARGTNANGKNNSKFFLEKMHTDHSDIEISIYKLPNENKFEYQILLNWLIL